MHRKISNSHNLLELQHLIFERKTKENVPRFNRIQMNLYNYGISRTIRDL